MASGEERCDCISGILEWIMEYVKFLLVDVMVSDLYIQLGRRDLPIQEA